MGHVVWKEGKSGMGSWLEGNVNGVMLYGRREMGMGSCCMEGGKWEWGHVYGRREMGIGVMLYDRREMEMRSCHDRKEMGMQSCHMTEGKLGHDMTGWKWGKVTSREMGVV